MNLSTNKTIIRSADENDAESILVLVRELALYENAADQVTATVHDYESNLKKGKIFCKIAEVDHKMVGIALYYETFSTWRGLIYYLEDFIVSEKYRGFGIGKMLMEAFITEAISANATLVKWQVLDWNEPAIKFYEKMGAKIEKEWWNVKMFLKEI
ncbi:MAG: GNAT family N-acetyltransferase [Saprospirales bacterium]|jgi:ribosomal protein S18 acetylase RimI-like enzyme|nr:GNAT family N-acetyltransferase [Saprospirales bacterium]MDA9357832.1 GNAT family N-acetyltransferase [Saprospiraceae bacterium]MDB4824703.1 GNAT family N-acetyltransferase [Saprospiraceae bacterium]HAI57142.1 GNAT family N-acetyltransferase [Saprospirales bacterium]HCV51410.1 GNAT family N-acetyltransferase [Saprospirales bacterium]|tara:strand:+ start:15924 stop:16391 length:468 start_codon:yes stop_codon:yes gene_type:complete